MSLLKKIEPYFFFLLVFIYALPVLLLHFFPTIDGPAHLYNSNLLNHYFFSPSSGVDNYFSFNAEPEPNWLGHILLCLFNSFLPSYLAEKIVILLYVFSMPIAFRALIKKLAPENIYASYFGFPLIYTLLFYLGFYNFCLSISLLLFMIYYRYERTKTVWSKINFTLLLLLLYFAHLFSFLLFIAIDLYFYCIDFKKSRKEETTHFTFKAVLLSILPYLPGILLTINFLIKKSEGGKAIFLPASTLVNWIKEAAPFITLNHDKEYLYTTSLNVVWILLFVYVLFTRLRRKEKLNVQDNWLLIALVILAAYFILPDDAASGGYISLRIVLYFFVFFIFWLSLQSIHKLFYIIAASISVILSMVLLNKHYEDSKVLSADANEMYSAVNFIEEGNSVLPLNYSSNWMHANFSNYLGSEKNIIVLDNYEAAKPHFPLKWKENKCPYNVAGDFANSNSPCLTLQNYETVSNVRVDYITRWCYSRANNDSCTIEVNSLLAEKFEKVYSSPSQKMEVFKRIKD